MLNGFKTLETRNNELFAPYEGRRVVVRVGMKDWDNASWKLWHPAGAADLRPGFRRGDAAGVVDVGETRRLLRGRGAARLRLRRGLWGFRHGHIEREVVPEAVARARLPGRRRPRRAGGPRRRGGRGHGEGGRSPGDRRRRGAREEDGEPSIPARAAPERARRRRLGVVVRAHDVVSTSATGNTTSNKVPYPEHDTHASTWPPRPSSIVVGAAAAAPGAEASSVNWIASAAGRVLK